jgi:hypothetical protein
MLILLFICTIVPDQQIAVPQRAPAFANGRGGHVTLRQKIAAQTIANLAGVDAIVLLFAAAMARSING